MRDVAAVILAAGGSSRLGRPKQLLAFDGKPLICRAVDVAVAAGCGPIVVVVGLDADACEASLRGTAAVVVRNPDWAIGLGTSVRAGFTALPVATDRAILMLADQPAVTAETLNRLADAHDRTGRPVCAAGYAGTIGPPVLVSGDAIARLRAWPLADGAKRLWQANLEAVKIVPCPEAADDIDTEADYERLSKSNTPAAGRP